MRLLRRGETGNLSLTEFADDATPLYAILSHTWGKDSEEVNFDDMINGTGKNKPGYEKIWFCEEQAVKNGLKYFWIDTSLDAINLMFRWYSNAARCYVYLLDVPTISVTSNRRKELPKGWESDFWKSSLEQLVHEITGIPRTALQGTPLSHFSTKLKEDKAYLLLGIFDIDIPLRYGEGMASAFKRVEEEINKLSTYIQDLRTTDPRDDKKRIENTKGDQLFYFFCQATDSRINNARAVLRGLLYLLVALSEILANILQDPSLNSTYLIVDALDECVDLPKLLDFILQQSSISSRVKWIVSSRNEAHIEKRLQLDGSGIRLSLKLIENAAQVSLVIKELKEAMA
ncbi:hypothetical protein BCR34DRAFT_670650 [Clohesyomyces aquaticus]|uniref:Nephrocystin 3-like N-terminal domain-containing protein n=1 Tax=Clohesyomyces aquaticus TaxID=1231657 RepID=A0A1Y2A966_9PLEO|nr:hypothetical protein BCR34DRAFT_670650 [Clohesyomyces aquaticus]